MPMCDIIMEEQKEPDLMVSKEDLEFNNHVPDVLAEESNPHNVSMEALPSSPGPFESSLQLTLPTESAIPIGPELPPISLPYSDVLAGELSPSPAVGVCGLHNIGNTCFMNAGLQCLFANPLIVQYFLSDFELTEGVEDTLAGKFAALLEKVWSGKYLVLHPADFKNTLAMYHSQFKDFRQEDCQEFLAMLINSLNEQLNEASGHDSNCLPPLPSSSTLPQMPTLEDLYMKDTKVLNTNVLAEDEESKEMKVDSEKYHKQDNLDQQQQQQEQEEAAAAAEDEEELMLLAAATKGDAGAEAVSEKAGPSKPVKDTNLLANHKPHKAPEMYAKKFLFSELAGGKTFREEDYSINNIKRMKIDDEEKNLRSRRQREAIAAQAAAAQSLPITPSLPPVSSEQIVNKPYCQNADKAWQMYLDQHPSVFVKTFQGQFKSTVVCQECHHMSVAYDPFMYLSVPIPFAMERQMSVVFIPCDSRPPVRYLLTLHKQEKVLHLRQALMKHIKEENADLVIAEVFNNHISRKLEDSMQLKVVNDECRVVYAFEMIPPPEIDDKSDTGAATTPPGSAMSPNNLLASTPEPPPNNLHTPDLTPNNLLGVERAERAERGERAENQGIEVTPIPPSLQLQQSPNNLQHVPPIDPNTPGCILPAPNNLSSTPCLATQIETLLDADLGEMRGPTTEITPPLSTSNSEDSGHSCCLSDESIKINVSGTSDALLRCMSSAEDGGVAHSSISDDTSRINLSDDSLKNNVSDDSLKNNVSDDSLKNNVSDDSLKNNVSDDSLKNNVSDDSPKNINSDSDDARRNNNADESLTSEKNNLTDSLRVNFSEDSMRSRFMDDSVRNNESIRINISEDTPSRNNNNMGAGMSANMEPATVTGSPLTDSFIDNRSAWEGGESKGVWDAAPPTSDQGAEDTGAGGDASTEPKEETSGAATAEEEEVAPPTDTWKSCAICLEDMMDFELMVHSTCGGMLCHACLEMSFKHYGSSFVCPVCSASANPDVDFIQMDVMADYKPKTRLLTVAVVQRYQQTDGEGLKLFGHPNILYLPSQLTGEQLYAMVDRVVPLLQNYTIVLTDGQGLHCSRCLYTSPCTGCEISRAGEVSLQPNDHLAIAYTAPLADHHRSAADTITDDPSMALRRPNTELTIYDCFAAFTQSDILDEQNPWFCAQCNRNQCAKKTMTVWRYPNTLVVYLKRFVFHDLMSSKVENRVDFPLTGLDLSEYISGPTDDNLLYDLISCVCHFGGVSSGHYTAYAKNCVSGEWWYYNDDVTTQQEPTAFDHVNNAYVLFYQKQGTKVDLSVPAQLRFLPKDLLNAASGSGDQPSDPLVPTHLDTPSASDPNLAWLDGFGKPPQPENSPATSRLSSWLSSVKPEEGKREEEEEPMDFYS